MRVDEEMVTRAYEIAVGMGGGETGVGLDDGEYGGEERHGGDDDDNSENGDDRGESGDYLGGQRGRRVVRLALVAAR